MIKRLGLWGFVVVGLAVAGWAAASLISPTVSCYGVAIGPGEVCERTSISGTRGEEIRTYEQRRAIVSQQAPFGVLAGLVIAGFGAVLIRREGKAQASSDIGP